MTSQTIEALRAAAERIAIHRKALHRAAVLCRVYPDGINFVCTLTVRADDEKPSDLMDARGNETVTWDQLQFFDAKAAVAVVDRVCAKAHALLGTKVPPE